MSIAVKKGDQFIEWIKVPGYDTPEHITYNGQSYKVDPRGDQNCCTGDYRPAINLSPLESVIATFTLIDGADFKISKQQERDWEKEFPSVDVWRALREYKGYAAANPRIKLKTREEQHRSIVHWLSYRQSGKSWREFGQLFRANREG